MGIPKFFRFISERWPLISDLIQDDRIPEFDNLYLDMNSILHNCTHGNDDAMERLTESQIMTAIFAYIDHLFTLIKPKKTFFMAIDGVAPRAKMNQQRSRRFRTALDAEKALEKAEREGIEIPKEPPFDTNSITPGTEFMKKVSIHLKYFINAKVMNDKNWQGIEIVLSGHEVPGEGEHKIMEYIRGSIGRDDYDVNLRHCIYGLDADLIMLGLVTHIPHFALLREEVVFGRRGDKQKRKTLEDENFYLLHLSLVREYLQLEFDDLKDAIEFEGKFKYNFENLLDDFIFIMYVIGNDFLPNLPDLHINKGAFPVLIQTFKNAFIKGNLDGYLNENGVINMERFKIWLDELEIFERRIFEGGDALDVDWFNQELQTISIGNKKKILERGEKRILQFLNSFILQELEKFPKKIVDNDNDNDDDDEDDDEEDQIEIPSKIIGDNLQFLKKIASEFNLILVHSSDSYIAIMDHDAITSQETVNLLKKNLKKYIATKTLNPEDEEEKKKIYNEKFDKWRDGYYIEKFGFHLNNEEEIKNLTENYIEGLQWVLFYYYKGVQSWPWFYKYHYSPRISDIKKGLGKIIDFKIGKPFKPFEQLMAVLPARSRSLLPLPYRALMTDQNSPIIDFYPNDVELDMNGKTADWEAVVKIQFVDEVRLLEAMKPVDKLLTDDEKKRNSFGEAIQFIYNPQVNRYIKSSIPGVLDDIEDCHCIETTFIMPGDRDPQLQSKEPKEKDENGLIKGSKSGKYLFAGFPTLKTISFKSDLELAGIVIFQQPTRSESRILKIENLYKYSELDEILKFLGRKVYINWPYLREAKVIGISTYDTRFSLNNRQIIADSHEKYDFRYDKVVQNLSATFAKNRGIQVGSIDILVHVNPLRGLLRSRDGWYRKDFNTDVEEIYPLQLVVKKVANVDLRYKERRPAPVEEEFKLHSKVVFLGDFAYGEPAEVVGHEPKESVTLSIKSQEEVELKDVKEYLTPTFGKTIAALERRNARYYPSFEVSKILKLHPLVLSRITSTYMIEHGGKKRNVGLDLKFESKKLKALGYTQRHERGWQFSKTAIDLIYTYMQEFPELFQGIIKNMHANIPRASEIFNGMDRNEVDNEIKKIKEWLSNFKSKGYTLVSLESEGLSQDSIKKIENLSIQFLKQSVINNEPVVEKTLHKVPRDAILNPSVSSNLLSTQRFQLGDRVSYVQESGKVALFSKGTVVAIHSSMKNVTVDVIFDAPLLGSNTLAGTLKTNRGLNVETSMLLNISSKQLVYHSAASKKRYDDRQDQSNRNNNQQRYSNVPVNNVWKRGKNINESSPPLLSQNKKVEGTTTPVNAKKWLKKTQQEDTKPTEVNKEETTETIKAPVDSTQDKVEEKNSKFLLSLLNGSPNSQSQPNEPPQANPGSTPISNSNGNPQQAFANFFSQYGGGPPMPMPLPMNMPFPPPPNFVPGMPMPPFPFPGFVPQPQQFMPTAQNQPAPLQPHQQQQTEPQVHKRTPSGNENASAEVKALLGIRGLSVLNSEDSTSPSEQQEGGKRVPPTGPRNGTPNSSNTKGHFTRTRGEHGNRGRGRGGRRGNGSYRGRGNEQQQS